MRLVIGGPTLSTVPASFAVDLAELYAYTQKWSGGAVWLRFVQSTYVHAGREAVFEAALAIHATHLLWLDTDMRVPSDTVIRLLAAKAPIVACNCVMRDRRRIFTAQIGGERVETRLNSRGLQAVDSVGLAVMLMRMDVVAEMPRPLFRHGLNDTGGDIGEDVMFCRALREAGHEILIDHDLSKEIGHIGQYTYRPVGDAALSV